MKILLDDAYKKLVGFLNKGKFDYIIIGGIAAGILGEPRVTGDIDVDIVLAEKDLDGFLKAAKKESFKVDRKKCLARFKEAGVFQIEYGPFHVDFIMASIDLEKEAIRRKKIVKLYGMKAFFPTPEDFILLKIVPGRPKDLIDAERVVARHGDKLDTEYLYSWARRLSDDAQDTRIYNELQRLLARKT